jgi:mannose-1-phosphate guanylyltransferase
MAFNRAKKLTNIENIYTITNLNYKFHCLNQSNILENNIIIEPEAKNTL